MLSIYYKCLIYLFLNKKLLPSWQESCRYVSVPHTLFLFPHCYSFKFLPFSLSSPITLPSNIKGVEQREACFQVCSIRGGNKCCHLHVQGREEREPREGWAKH